MTKIFGRSPEKKKRKIMEKQNWRSEAENGRRRRMKEKKFLETEINLKENIEEIAYCVISNLYYISFLKWNYFKYF